MSEVKVKISMEVLNSMSPKKGMMNAAAGDLENQTFVLHSMVAPDKKKVSLESQSEDNMFVKARYVNQENGKAFLVPIRGLLNMEVVKIESENEVEFEDGVTVTSKVHEFLMESASDKGGIHLPPKFKVVSVKNRVQKGTDNIMYPPYCYQAFNDRVAEIKEADADANLDEIYNDFDFMMDLYSGALSERGKSQEPNKDLVIAV